MALDEGYIKFNLQWKHSPSLPKEITEEIIRYRYICFQKKYIGITEGIGYGNISVRYKKTKQFIISGTQTGGLKRLSSRHFTLVTKVDFEKNSVSCKGPVKASAESLTHAMFYQIDEAINAVIHIHHSDMWNRLKHKVPTTGESIPYGTTEMCREVKHLYHHSALKSKRFMVMAGHQDGIISFGDDLSAALRTLDRYTLNS